MTSRKKIGVQYSSINGNGFGGYGEIVYGTKGTLILEKEQELSDRHGTRRGPQRRQGFGRRRRADARHAGQRGADGRGQQAAGGGPGQPRLCRGAGALGLVHPPSAPPRTSPAAVPKVAMADAIIALTHEHGRPAGPADRVQEGMVRHPQRRDASCILVPNNKRSAARTSMPPLGSEPIRRKMLEEGA